ncbi:MAG: FecR domain-containing protein [Gammaproteobacteria bacterium]|nr:FecR domain-containing protein [Gammaproteobacteria bacterium]
MKPQLIPPATVAWLGLVVVAMLLLVSPTWAAEPIGKLIVAAGKIEALGVDGKVRRLRRQAEIYKGDTLITGGDVFAQLRFKDGALIALRPDTEFTIEDYRFDGAEDGSERAIFKLIKGGFRTITGAIGHKNKENYQVSTPVATIGIRGTHYGVRQVTPELAAQRRQAGEDIQPGLYGGVVDGEIAVRNGGGENTFGNDRYFYVASPDAAPETLIAPPGVVFDEDASKQADNQDDNAADGDNQGQDDTQQAQGNGDDQQGDGEGTETAQGGAEGDGASADQQAGVEDGNGDTTGDGGEPVGSVAGDSTSSSSDSGTSSRTGNSTGTGPLSSALVVSINPDTSTLPTTLNNNVVLSTSTESVFTSNETVTVSQATSSSFTRAPVGAGVSLAFIDRQTSRLELISSVLTDNGTDNFAIFYDVGSKDNIQVKQARTQGSGESNQTQTHAFNFGTATLAEFGKDAASGASWGRWSGDYVVTTDGANNDPVTDLHFVYSPSQASSATISAASSRAEPITLFDKISDATTAPTDLNGNVGSYEYFLVGINFATQKLVGYEVKATVGGATYQVELQNDLALADVLKDQSAQLTGKCTGCGTSTSVTLTGDGSVMFIDDALSYIGASYSLRDNSSSYGIAGAAVLQSALTRTQEVNAPSGATALTAFISVDSNSTKKREIQATVQNGTTNLVKTATVNSVGNVVTNTIQGANTSTESRFESNRAFLTDTGGNTVGVNWGRWQDGWSTKISGVNSGSAGHAHFIYSDKVTNTANYPALSSASFTYLGGTSPTDELGRTGSITSATMSVDFLSQSITSYNINATTPGRTWALNSTTTTSFVSAKSGNMALTGTCTGCSTTPVVGSASTEFVGNNASHAISSFGGSIADNSNQIVGTALFKR